MDWTREQLILALDLYCRIPFSKATNSNVEIIKLANLLGRSVNSVKMMIGNFGSFDPELKRLQIAGLSHASKLSEKVWNTYVGKWNELAYEAEKLRANYEDRPIEHAEEMIFPLGLEREQKIKQRINQSFFRASVLSSYNYRCCITGLQNEQLLEACHISDWADDEANRTNPANGLCMNILMHRAFDKWLLSVSPDYVVYVSEQFKNAVSQNSTFYNLLCSIDQHPILRPNRFLPNKELLDNHHKQYIQNQ